MSDGRVASEAAKKSPPNGAGMRIGISGWTYAWNIGVAGFPAPAEPFAAADLLQKARACGAEVVQIADNLPLEKLSGAELDALAARADALGIAVEVGTRGVRPDHLLPFLEIAARLRSPIVRTLLHDDGGKPALEEAEARVRAALPSLREKNLLLAVENHDFFAAREMARLMRRLDDPLVGVCLDPVNNFAKGEGTAEVLSALGPYTVNFHCKDYTIRRKPGNLGFDVEGCAAGDGLLDMPRCIDALPNRAMSCIVELWTPWQGNLKDTAQLEEAWAVRSVDYLSALFGRC